MIELLNSIPEKAIIGNCRGKQGGRKLAIGAGFNAIGTAVREVANMYNTICYVWYVPYND